MRICIVGAGAIGGTTAAALIDAGAEASLLARGEHLRAIRADGLIVQGHGRNFRAYVPASDNAADLGAQDMVIVAVKAPALPAAAGLIGPLLGRETAVVFLLNGIPWWYFQGHGGSMEGRRIPLLDPRDGLRDAVATSRILGGVVRCSATLAAPGQIRVTSPVSKMILGEADDAPTSRCAELVALLTGGGIAAQRAPDIRTAIWEKLIGNLMDGPLAVLTGARSDMIFADATCQTIARRIASEARAIALRMGRQPSVDVEASILMGQQRVHLPSLAQDLARGKPMEIASLLEVPLSWAREFGVATPVLDDLAALTKLRALASGLRAC